MHASLPALSPALPLHSFDLQSPSQLPDKIRFGTSSWTYLGWKGLVYHDFYRDETTFRKYSLKEYADFSWFRTVGIDGTFYRPPSLERLQHYASLVPSNFQWVCKVWEEITIPIFPKHKRYGERAGKINLNFFDERLMRKVLQPFADPKVKPHVGPMVLQFQTFPVPAFPRDAFFERLDRFLGALPTDFRFAVEVRNKSFLNRDYFSILNRHGATHCFNHWTKTFSLLDQMKRAAAAGGLKAPFFVSRLLTPLNVTYEQAMKRFQPYDGIKESLPQMRDDVVRLAFRALDRNIPAFILANNRLEGSAPRTIHDIGLLFLRKLEERESAKDP